VSTRAGLWIDLRNAVIVTVSESGSTTQTVESDVERHVRYSSTSSGNGAHGSGRGRAEDTRERRFEGQLAQYYDEVIALVRDAQTLLIFGPGEAKDQLRNRLEKQGLSGRIVEVSTVDKMTVPQIEARVRDRLGH
jgi:hypothetical protein